MKLILRLLPQGGAYPADARILEHGTLTIGRGAECDWVLADPERTMSKRHCQIDSSGDGFVLTDLSTNGVFLNTDLQPMGRGHVRQVADGDRIGLGPYVLEASVEQDTPTALAFDTEASFATSLLGTTHDSTPLASPIEEPWLDALPTGNFGPDLRPAPLGWDEPPDAAGYGATGALQAGALQDAAHPVVATAFAEHSEHLAAGSTLMRTPAPQVTLPSDWNDTDPLATVEFARSNMAADILAPMPEPSPAFETAPVLPPLVPSAQPAPPPPQAVTAPILDAVPTPPGAGAAGDALLAGFLETSGLPLESFAGMDMQAAGRDLGLLVRSAVEGVRDVLATRAMVKAELRIDLTIVQAVGNNAMKFAPDVQRCLAAMVGQPPDGFLHGSAAMQQSLDDIKLHELALVAALNTVFTDLAQRLDPEQIMARIRAENALGSALPMVSEARAWAVYQDEYRALQGADGTENTGGSLLSPLATAYARQVRRAV